MADAFTTSQTDDTSPVPYDQVLLVSQDTINAQLKNMWETEGKESKLRKLKISNAAGKIEAELKAPEISLNVVDKTKPIYYFLKFESGTLKLKKSDDWEDTSSADFNVAGWIVCFASQISRKMVTKDQKEFDIYSAKTGLKDGVFSLAKLYLDSTTSTLPIAERSSYGNVNWDNYKGTTVGNNFQSFVSRWITDMGTDQKNVIGYSVLATDTSKVNPHAPTFPVTAIDYCNYPWRDPSTKRNLQIDENDIDGLPENAFSYLITTQFKTPPKGRELTFSGAFVNKAHGATLCMNRELFWDSWLLGLLRKLARGSEIIPFTPILKDTTEESKKKWPDFKGYSVSTGPSFGFGQNEDHLYVADSYFDLTSHGTEWVWNGSTLTKSAKLDMPNTSISYTAEQTAQSSMRVAFVSGEQRILVTGDNSFKFNLQEKDGQEKKGYSNFGITTWWHLTFALGAVEDGGLQITRMPDPAGTSCVTQEEPKILTHEISWNYPFEDFAKSVANTLQDWFGHSLAWLTNDLIAGLEHHHKLFLPASGVFLMQAPRLNKRGDLLVDLHYNGAQAPVDTRSDSTTGTSNKASIPLKAANRFSLAGDHVPEAFRHLPMAWSHLPARQSRLPVEPGSDIPAIPTFVPQSVTVFSG